MQTDELGSRVLVAIRTVCLLLVLLTSMGGAVWAAESEPGSASENQPARRLMEAGYVNVNLTLQGGGRSFRELVSPTETYGERTGFETLHSLSSAAGLELALGLRLWRNLAVGVGATHSRVRDDVVLTGTVPHPLFYDRGRDLSRDLGGYYHTRTGIHVHALWTLPLADRLDVAFSAGPSLFLVSQDRVSDVVITSSGPTYDEYVAEPMATSVSARAIGVNAGVDVTYHLFRQLEPGTAFWTVGIGFFVRWTEGALEVASEVSPEQPTRLDVGGLAYGAGLRFRF